MRRAFGLDSLSAARGPPMLPVSRGEAMTHKPSEPARRRTHTPRPFLAKTGATMQARHLDQGSTVLTTEEQRERLAAKLARKSQLLSEAEASLYQAERERSIAERQAPLSEVLVLLSNDSTAKARFLKARATKLLADIKRDRGVLRGMRGAFSMYQQSRELLVGTNEPLLEIELALVEASCMEMSNLNDQSIGRFVDAEQMSGDRYPWFRSWAQLRQSTNLIKMGLLGPAVQAMENSFASSSDLTSSSWRAEQLMKLSSLNIARKQPALAVQNAHDAAALFEAPSKLAIVRQNVQLGDALYEDRQFNDARKALQKARGIAEAENFLHQLKAIVNLESRFPESLPPRFDSGRPALFTPLRKEDIL